MKKTCISPMRVALSVCWYIQMVSAKCVMLEASTETICPIQTVMKAFMPEGWRMAGLSIIGGMEHEPFLLLSGVPACLLLAFER
ncbi:MAG TPA: hypothetical protein PKK59_09265 [Anaerolineaceae bacterium]|nr:hypothetical protein [Anaerolineaceae bacterium]